MFKQAKASGEILSWKMHDSPYINHIKSWATCFLRVVFWEDPWLFYRAGHANLMFFLPLYWELYITSTETILLTVWSCSLLTWPLNRWREYNKQGQSKSNPPSTRCRFGKLYPGKWSFLKPFVVILLTISLDHASKFIFSSPQSPNSPMVSIHPGYHFENKGLAGREMLRGWPSVCRSCWVSASRSQPFFHIVLIVCGWSRASVATHASSMRMVVCSSRWCNFCMYCWFVEKLWYMVWFLFLNWKHEAIIFCAVKSVCLGHIQLAAIIWMQLIWLLVFFSSYLWHGGCRGMQQSYSQVFPYVSVPVPMFVWKRSLSQRVKNALIAHPSGHTDHSPVHLVLKVH